MVFGTFTGAVQTDRSRRADSQQHQIHDSLVEAARLLVAAVLEENLVGLVDLGAEGVGVLNQVQQIRVVHLEQHASELAGLLWVDVLHPT